MATMKNAEQLFRERLVEFFETDGAPSQRAVARSVDMHYVHLNKILKGHVVPGLDLADRICRAIGSYLDQFIDDNFRVSSLIPKNPKKTKRIA